MVDEQTVGDVPICKKCGRVYIFGEKKLCPECMKKSRSPISPSLVKIDLNNIDYKAVFTMIADDRFDEKEFQREVLKYLIEETDKE